MRFALSVAILVAVSGCSMIEGMRIRHDLSNARSEALAKVNVEACRSTGGKVEGVGIFGLPACVAYFTDGGKDCRNKSDCQSDCIVPEVVANGTEAQGTCARSDHDFFGCYSRIDHGRAVESMCQD